MLHRFHHAVGFDQFVEDVLQDVFDIAGVGDPLANEVAESRVLSRDRFGDPLVLLHHRPLFSQRLVHL